MSKLLNSNVRTRLIEAAVRLAHQHGFGNTRLADIAKAAKVPPGNLYYYFKTKEEIGEAIVERRFAEWSAAHVGGGANVAENRRFEIPVTAVRKFAA